ncbi:hypothetical protein HPP92_008118 [Vanilla planifolia]|uniref:Midasin n=1 Tax=Vanilla planifolia TaxID=51239 RepID=A0A835V8F6_VANPL|nr:hypothetical protein HPP92_008118 [Vanilla planifolia]
MSFDGSFTCEVALSRFLSRCPELRSNAKLVALLQKGRALSSFDLVAAIADPFLHPSYTIPVVGCFRALCGQVVQSALAKLFVVRGLMLESEENGEDIGEEDMHVVDFYAGRHRGLKLHELACLAFCRAVDLAPFLLQYVLIYFQSSPPPFRRLMLTGTFVQLTHEIVFATLNVVRISYRLLLLDPKVFSKLWDWSVFLELLKQISSMMESSGPWLDSLLDIRWCGIQILSIVFCASDSAVVNFGMREEEAFTCLLRWKEFCEDTAVEKAGWYLQGTEMIKGTCLDDAVDLCHIKPFDCSSLSNSICSGSEKISQKEILCEHKQLEGNFVLTTTLKRSFEMVVMAVIQRWPVLLFGPAGCGKTALINHLALKSGNRVLFIHMDEQMDSKSLIGSYVNSEHPGEFRWQPGSLMQALVGGLWVVFEDIDKAPNEIQSIILPLLEGSSSFVTVHGEMADVSESFRLFGTVSTSRTELNHSEGRFSYSILWRKVMVQAPTRDDLIDIINARFLNLDQLSTQLVETFERVNSFSQQMRGPSASAFDSFSIRDLLKWCNRITGSSFNLSGLGLSAYDRQNIYQEAVDIFVSCLHMLENRLLLKREIANLLNISCAAETVLYPSNKPTIQMLSSGLQIGRTLLCCERNIFCQNRTFVSIRSALYALERIACSVRYNEPVLLVGETGTGKTTLVQYLAARLGRPLTVLNLSQQSDVADLLGGFKPADARSICMPLYHEFKKLFCKTFSEKDNEALLRHCEEYILEKKWKKLLRAFQKSVHFAQKNVGKIIESGAGSKRKRPLSEKLLQKWESFSLHLDCVSKKIDVSSGISFKFVEGAFVTALRTGQWLLLDEVNLAPLETLQRIISVLDGEHGTLCLAERGDVNYVERHPQFRLFACMNPATDAGKRDLPFSFRSRFSEYFIDDVLDDEDLNLYVNQYMGEGNATVELCNKIVRFYKAAKRESEERLQDSANQKPQYSLRSLSRALVYIKMAEKRFGFQRALYDGFCMFFVTLLDCNSAKIMHNMILSYLLPDGMPRDVPFNDYFSINLTYHDTPEKRSFVENYVITRSVKEQLKNLARAFYIRRYPVLLQGPTSSGKTSLVQYLASVTGHEFVRINNHEHTDLQEYFGTYITDSHGKLEFQEGVLVKAVRKGYWIILDELNLAPSDVLEALNRLLDDNRELFVPELQETIPAHPDFMLFATQNPPIAYGGRKILSRAFRNRFLEIHVDEIPEDELTTILENRCSIPASYASKMIKVMKDLQLHRQNSRAFAGKHGFITPRDLFRWANRFRAFGKSYYDLAKDGYFLLAERLREEREKNVVREALNCHLNVKLAVDELYDVGQCEVDAVLMSSGKTKVENLGSITWTKSMLRLYFLVERCYRMREPVLLVGGTGGGKTTVCQLLSIIQMSRLHVLNCHQYTETSDFVGGFHPIRERPILASEFKHLTGKMKESKLFLQLTEDFNISSDISQASSTLCHLNKIEASYKQCSALYPDVTPIDFEIFKKMKLELIQLQQKWQTVFVWQDGPLVEAMKAGDIFLVDEISLADDSVLERLNSVLEPERMLLLAEKGGSSPEKVIAHHNFFVVATMNPGGDYGKKELSPALRNRFTEIWVEPVSDIEELRCIALEKLSKPNLSFLVNCILEFWKWFSKFETRRMLTVRDLLSWISFVNLTEESLGSEYALLHGAFLVLLDGISLGTGISKSDSQLLRNASLEFLIKELKASGCGLSTTNLHEMEIYGWGDYVKHEDIMMANGTPSEHLFGIDPFFIDKGNEECKHGGFEFLAPTTRRNVMRVLRAMQLPKPILLEGSPGVGKTSLVVALAQQSGHTVVRINLSEQTDMMDLLGSDLPVEGSNGMEFCWSDGILLQALKNGSWVLLDELNLAPQAVLEGLNAILDHRAEVYIPELGLTFKCPPSFRVFACQNPSSQGGGRKGLPKSFLNRFTKVHVDELAADDYLFICQSRFPSISSSVLSKLIAFVGRLYEDIMVHRKYGQDGAPWVFNLRDVIRSCEIIQGASMNAKLDCFLNVIFLQRMRSYTDRKEVMRLYEEVFDMKPSIVQFPEVYVNPKYVVVGSVCVQRNHFQPTKAFRSQLNLLPGLLQILEAVALCVRRQWLCVLVGPAASGKTSVIRLLAELTGNVLNELNLSSGTDVSELLGCFEQHSSFRNFKVAISQIERFVDEYFSLRLEINWKDFIEERRDLFSKWFSFFSSCDVSKSSSLFSTSWMGDGICSSFLDPLVEIIEQLKHDVKRFSLPVSWTLKELDGSLKIIHALQKNWQIRSLASFEWVPGNLVKSIEFGEWIVLDNANLCNPTVLDRINSLVEPDGSIMINECGMVDGKPLLMKAHPNFRMFITVDPRYGEISRAMRNRGVEIFMLQPDSFTGEVTEHENIEVVNLKTYLIQSGIPSEKMVLAMCGAHMSARAVGTSLGVRITLLEIARWVQLFQQLIMNGNGPIWSLHLSWEHTYLAALGEPRGREVIMQGKASYLSDIEMYQPKLLLGCSLTLPGGWPLPHMLRNLAHYSRESCVEQNCLYLFFLSSQYASYNMCNSVSWSSLSNFKGLSPAILPAKMLHQFLFPNAPLIHKCADFDFVQFKQMLFFAANWAIEQATENDIDLYILWFKAQNMKLQHYCCFLEDFLKSFEQEMNHPIWKCIVNCRKELLSYHGINIDKQPIPLLSLKLLEFPISDPYLMNCQDRLVGAVNWVRLLRHTYHQWNTEEEIVPREDTFLCAMRHRLHPLRQLESEVLKLIVEFNDLIHEYSYLLELHILFWENVKSHQLAHLPIIWCWLEKQVIKFQPKFPEAAGAFLIESLKLKSVSDWKFNLVMPALWVHGGHPFVPSSSVLFYKLKQLRSLCEAIWPTRKFFKEIHTDDDARLDSIVSANADLRHLATEGLSMSTYIIARSNHCHTQLAHQLDEIFLRLLGKFEHDKRCLEPNFSLSQNLKAPVWHSKNGCCIFSLEMLCHASFFDCLSEVLPLFNRRCLNIDVKLILMLSKLTLLDASEAHKILHNFNGPILHVLDYSLENSSRSPTDFSPHQTILWIFDAYTSLDSVGHRLSSLILEMWYGWNSSLWNFFSDIVKSYPLSGSKGSGTFNEFSPTRTQILSTIINGVLSIKDYNLYRLKLRITSRALWEDAPLQGGLINVLSSMADCFFKKILFVHKKHFEKDMFVKLKSILIELRIGCARDEVIQTLRSQILTSRHPLFSSLMTSVIDPLLKALYMRHESIESMYNLGLAWVHIGILRFNLLNPEGPDPVIKAALKHSWILQRISLLELEIKVRGESGLLAGKFNAPEDDRLKVLKEQLEKEEKLAQTKVVFRPEHSKYEILKSAFAYVFDLVASCTSLLNNARCSTDIDIMIEMAKNWQVTAESFINKLSDEFADYVDLVQPVQVAVYEMKLGLSLVIPWIMERQHLKKTGKLEMILAPVFLIMQFPKVLSIKSIYDNNSVGTKVEVLSSGHDRVEFLDISLLNSLIAMSDEIRPARRLWMDVQSQARAHEEGKAQYYEFRPRSVVLDDIVEGIITSLDLSDSEVRLSTEGQELLMEREFATVNEPLKEAGNIEEDRTFIPESILRCLVRVHNSMFGSGSFLEHPNVCIVTKEDRLLLFVESYKLGTMLMEGFQSSTSSAMDDNILPEHLLHVCLEYESFGAKASHPCNIYKESDPEIMFRMVKPLIAIQNKVAAMLEEWPDHPGLKKINDATEALLKISPCTPLSKVLLGLQLLVCKVQFMQENDSRFSLKDELQPICSILSSWQKFEVDSWPSLLDDVCEQYEINAGKLWFPLQAVIRRNFSGDKDAENILTIQSVEDFIWTSNVGEFKKRLHLLLALHGQLKDGVHLNVYSSPHVEENLKILYNAFGYYVQFLPSVLECIEVGRGSAEKEIKEHVKLFNWEHPQSRLSLENFRRTRQKVWKLVQKFNDTMQQPVMTFLNQEAKSKRAEDPAWLKQNSSVEVDKEELHFPINLEKLRAKESFHWLADWVKKAEKTLETIYNGKLGKLCTSCEEVSKHLKMTWDDGWAALERICSNAAVFSHLWKHETRNLRKRRGFNVLLKTLEICGLSRHRAIVSQGFKSAQLRSSFLQPSYNIQHLLQPEHTKFSVDAISHNTNSEHSEVRCAWKWVDANKFYFKSLEMVQNLYDVSNCFSRDLSLELVNQVVSYVDHLVVIQQKQRSAAYGVSDQLRGLWKQCQFLSNIGSSGHLSLSPHQYAVTKHIYQQKDLFDSLLLLAKDIDTFLVTVKKSHVDSCNRIKREADEISALNDKFTPLFIQSKDELDRYLLGSHGTVTRTDECIPFVVSIQMEQSIRRNFDILSTLEEAVNAIRAPNGSSESMKESLLNRFGKLISEGKKESQSFKSEVEANIQSTCDNNLVDKLNAEFVEAFKCTNQAIVEVLGRIDFTSQDHANGGNITSWTELFVSFISNLHLDQIYDSLPKAVNAAKNLMNYAGFQKPELCSQIGVQLKNLHLLLEPLLEFAEGVLLEFLDVHRTIAEMTSVLVQIFIFLLSKGFGTAPDLAENVSQHGSQEISGTGMGDGEGINDVSDQIEDEAQLHGDSSKQDATDGSDKISSNKDRGIEMDEDFAADTFSVSEDSENSDDGDDMEDVNIESKMGETGDTGQTVDEKLWDKEKDDKPETSLEKYESGPSVEERNGSDKELRAKQEDASAIEESDQFGNEKSDAPSEEENDFSSESNADDANVDKDAVPEESFGNQHADEEENLEGNDINEAQGSDAEGDGDSVPVESDMEMKDDDLSSPSDPMDENDAFAEETLDKIGDADNNDDKNVELEPSKEYTETGEGDSVNKHPHDGVDLSKSLQNPSSIEYNSEQEMDWFNGNDMNNSIAPSAISKDEDPNLQFSMPNSSNGSKLAHSQPLPQISQGENQSKHLKETNPYRSMVEALENWKERVSVLADQQEESSITPEDMDVEETSVDFRYVSEGEKSTSQALGPATAEQIKNAVDGDKNHETEVRTSKEDDNRMENAKEHPETHAFRTLNSICSDLLKEESPEPAPSNNEHIQDSQKSSLDNFLSNVVSFRSINMDEKLLPFDNSIDSSNASMSMDNEEISEETNQKAITDWRRFERATSRLSQELVEQLRLVMEPTLASRLQGDYKTGKRINMKKVIPYIASHFRRDKIWLRRTKPNKRDYQVVVAIDDSRSMSESNCGDAAIEALVTVCRAMSLLEVGQFAVASFGRKGNIKLLHDFDQTFSGEAGAKIISSLSFNQDNTIADEPVVDLLKYLNGMLDAAVAKARTPCGQNPLQQLILIIADGRFHEKENLRRCIRNVLNRKRMIAFILLDSPRESIMDLMEASFEGQTLTFNKYLNAFPFPYYIVLNNIEALPRTLADLLRQWFELMQSMSD